MEKKPFDEMLAVRGLSQRVIVSAEELQVGSRRIPRSRIRQAFFIPATKSTDPMVRVEYNRFANVDIVVKDKAERAGLLGALGYDASQVVVQFPIRAFLPPSRALLAVLFMWSLVLLPVLAAKFPLALLLLGPLVAAFVVAQLVLKSNVSVGADGVLIRRFGLTRFVSYDDVVSVTAFYGDGPRLLDRGCDIQLALAGGKTIDISVAEKDEATALASRIRECAKVAKNGDAMPIDALGKGEMHTRDWVRRLKNWGAGAEAPFRHAAADLNRLWEVLESHAASPRDRAAAAVALSASAEPNVKVRIGAIAAAIAEPKLRVAIEAVNGDDAALEEAMDALAKEKEVRSSSHEA